MDDTTPAVTLDDIVAEVHACATVEAGAIALLDHLHAALAAAQDTAQPGVTIDSILTELQDGRAKLAAALTRNTLAEAEATPVADTAGDLSGDLSSDLTPPEQAPE